MSGTRKQYHNQIRFAFCGRKVRAEFFKKCGPHYGAVNYGLATLVLPLNINKSRKRAWGGNNGRKVVGGERVSKSGMKKPQ